MRSILIDHARRYPGWTADDVYKLLHQAAMGSEHAVEDEARARAWLLAESATLGPGPDDPLIDPIAPGGQIARVHLRPYVARGLDLELLLGAFLATASVYPASTESFAAFAEEATCVAREGVLGVPAEPLAARLRELEAAGLPALHHSRAYTEAYRPAYRVVAVEALPARLRPCP